MKVLVFRRVEGESCAGKGETEGELGSGEGDLRRQTLVMEPVMQPFHRPVILTTGDFCVGEFSYSVLGLWHWGGITEAFVPAGEIESQRGLTLEGERRQRSFF